MEYAIIQMCPGCIDYMLNGEGEEAITFTKPVCVCEVSTEDCDNLERDGNIDWNNRVSSRGTIDLEEV